MNCECEYMVCVCVCVIVIMPTLSAPVLHFTVGRGESVIRLQFWQQFGDPNCGMICITWHISKNVRK